ncbi:protein kinase domain-containing protein [Sorangium sp. So ce394]|uniref:serine/threonine-protein kinase n=1 Tax=Sorangium sp. So ce394 TaxID=3133310 RepID=UPI003F5B17D6
MSERPPETTLTPEEAAKQRAVSYLGRVISKRYRIDEVIAMGGMGAVYRGEHVHMHKRVAIKILHPDTERLPELVQRFEREAIAGAHIQHRNVATATDFGEAEDGSFFLVLEYVRGTTLHEIIRRGPMPAARAALIARQIAAALGATHAMSIVHRDVKPRNVMVVEPQGDLVKLIDFGLAKVSVDQLRRSVASPESTRMEGESRPVRLTTAGVIFGTIAYLAPESALGMDFVDERADLYALGLIFYEMLAGKHPFLAKDPVELFNQQRSAPVPAIAEHAPGVAVPPAIEAVVRRLLEKQPRARFESAAELIAALDAACAASGIVMDEPRAEMGSRAEMTSVPAIGEAARVPSNRPPLPSAAPPREPSNRPPPLPSAAPPREPEAGSGGSSAILLGDSCLVSLTDVADELEPAAQRAAGEPAGGGASASEPARGGDEATAGAEGEDEEDAASYSRPTPVRNTPTLVAELTRDSRPTAVGGAAFMAQVAFSREEAARDAAAEVEAAPLSSDSRPTAVGGAAFMAQVAFSREEAARDAASRAGAPSPRSGEQTASQEPAPLVSTPPPEEAPSPGPAEPVRSLEEPVPEEREGSATTQPPMRATLPAPSERGRSAPPQEKPSQPGTAELPAHAGERASSKPPSASAAGPASSKPPSASAGERASSKPPSAGERASSKPPSSPAAGPAPSKPPSSPAVERASSKPPSSPAVERASSKPPSSPAVERASSKPPSSPGAEPAPSKPPSSPAVEPAPSKPPSSPAAESAPSKPPSSPAGEPAPSSPGAEPAPSKPPSSPAAGPAASTPPSSPAAEPAPSSPAAESATSKPPAPSAEDPAPAKTPVSPAKSRPPVTEPPPVTASASRPPDEPPPEDDAPASEPTSERMSGSRPAFAPTLLRELEAAEAERVAREREEEAKRKLAEEAERAAKKREEKARRKRAAQEARASRRRDEGAGRGLGRLAPYLGGALVAVGVIAALASSGRAPPEPEPQLGQAAPAASALATSEPAPADAAAAPEASGPTTAAPEDAAQASPAAPEAPAEPPPDEATRKALTDAARARRWVKAAEALNLLAERDPTALRERPVAIAARNLAIAISKTGEELADQVFDALARRFGTAGLDVLYEIVETRGRSTPATRAAKLLRDPEVAARGTPAVRISFELRDATCGEKMPFLDRAVSEGDQRTLVVLETAVRPCYTKNRTIDEAIKKLRARLEGG